MDAPKYSAKIFRTKSTSISAVRLCYTYSRSFVWCRRYSKKQDACYCEFYRAVNFVVRDTVTIPCLTVVRNTVAIRLGAQEACSRLQLLAPSKKRPVITAPAVNTAYICLCILVLSLTQELTRRVLIFL